MDIPDTGAATGLTPDPNSASGFAAGQPDADASGGQPAPQADPVPAPQPDPNDALVGAIVDAVTARLALMTPPAAPSGDPAAPPAPSLASAASDALAIGGALLTHHAVPQKQSRALALMGLAAGVPAFAHAIGVSTDDVVPWLNGAALGLAFVAAAIGDFTGLFKGKPSPAA